MEGGKEDGGGSELIEDIQIDKVGTSRAGGRRDGGEMEEKGIMW